MCTAVTYKTKDRYFGRNLDYEYSYSETVTITPRNYPFSFRCAGKRETHFAMIGMAFVQSGYPLYYDAVNEKGLWMAGLNFPGNAFYPEKDDAKTNVAPFELIPYLLSFCQNVAEARAALKDLVIFRENFSDALPCSPLHWIVADGEECLVVEPMKDGLRIYENPVGILTNNPPFEFHLTNLSNYLNLTREEPKSRFSSSFELRPYSRGMGAIGLPGDLSSASRFVKAAFTKLNSVSGESEVESVSQFFHILSSVEQQMGCCRVEKGFEHTIYSACCNADRGIYYYTTYRNSRIVGVDLHREDLDAADLVSYPLLGQEEFFLQNGQTGKNGRAFSEKG